ncbi:MAG: 1-acyl-sn-glycerol-3-phosphate acyltransferase [Psychromonas sp.]|jgi:1-acyl-sn-glycerol-3-phosphate acyltransferase|uniref:lysophospholipid acyltransferase family protein n=1 Tax=Psychromonas sp. TaxID=1884585 RepID=UPI0039E2CA31
MDRILKVLFFGLFIKPIVFIVLGLNLRGRDKLPKKGPAILVANHNSHLDTIVLMSLYPLSMIHKVRPVAAADYFLGQGGLLAWLSLKCIGIVPMDRSGKAGRNALFSDCHKALDNGDILILFPEGSRGEPEQMSKLKKGIFFLLNDREHIKVTPVMMHGLGRSLPKGEALLVPFNCDVIIGDALAVTKKSEEFMLSINDSLSELSQHCITRHHVEV